MKRIKLKLKEKSDVRFNRLACQHPLCFPATFNTERYVINTRAGGIKIGKGGRDKIGHMLRDEKLGGTYAIGMALSDGEQFIDNNENPLPGDFDYKILFGLISIAIKCKKYLIDFNSAYAILTQLGISTNSKHYRMLWGSFDKWGKTSIAYQRNIRVYDKNKIEKHIKTIFIPAVFSVAQSYWDSSKPGETGVRIRFTPEFLKLLGIRFSAEIAYNDAVSKLKGATALNLYLYLQGLDGYLKSGKSVARDYKKLCTEKLSINKNTSNYDLKRYLGKALENINKVVTNGKYLIEFEGSAVIFKYKPHNKKYIPLLKSNIK